MNGIESLNFQLLDLLGSSYVIEHCIAAFQKSQEDKIFRDYLTECFRLQGQGKYLTVKYNEIIHPKPIETRTSEEIISHMKKKLSFFGRK